MKIETIYNTLITLESGDLIAVHSEKNSLWIRSGDNLYVACDQANEINLEGRINVNSAGYFSRDEDILPEMEWKEYISLIH